MSNDKFDTARQVLRQQKLTGERALFQSENLAVYDSVFEDGESPLKESSSLYLDNCLFRWKYPLWYCKHVDVKECTWFDMARAGVWYTDDISVRDSIVEAPKNFRRCRGVTLTNVNFPTCFPHHQMNNFQPVQNDPAAYFYNSWQNNPRAPAHRTCQKSYTCQLYD